MASRTFSTAFVTGALSASLTLSPASPIAFSMAWIFPSASFLASANSRFRLSSSACSSASRFIFSTSSFDRPDEPSMRIVCCFPVPRSFAPTLSTPFASRSKLTSIFGVPRGAGAMPSRWNVPICLLSRAIGRSPWNTCTSTDGWPSAAVVNTSVFLVGMVVFFGIITVSTPPSVSRPSDSGVTSSSWMSAAAPSRSCAPWMAAPTATTSSGFTPRCPSLPKISFTSDCTRGIRVMPPTITTSSIWFGFSRASASAVITGFLQRSKRWSTIFSNCVRVIDSIRCFGPLASAVMNGRLMSVCVCWLRSFFARSAASLSRCIAIGSFRRSMPFSFRNVSAMWSISTWSKSSPPRCVSPFVDSTWNTPSSPTSRMLMSNVPPPRSKTAIFSSFFLSSA